MAAVEQVEREKIMGLPTEDEPADGNEKVKEAIHPEPPAFALVGGAGRRAEGDSRLYVADGDGGKVMVKWC